MLIGFLVFIVVIGGAIWLLTFAIKQFKSAKSSSTRSTTERTEIINEGRGEPSGAVAQGTTDGGDSDTGGGAESAMAATSGETDTSPADGGAATTGSSDSGQGESVSTAEVPPPEAPPVQWPYLQVGGVVGKGLRGAATINGRIIAVGESIEGVEVIAIGDYGVKLECQNETRFAKVGSVIQ
jgi:hypothetical protein